MRFVILSIAITWVMIWGPGLSQLDHASANSPQVRFDTSAIVAACPHPAVDGLHPIPPSMVRYAIPIELSSLVVSPQAIRIDQMLIEVEWLDESLVVDDYSPRTVLASPYSGDITIEKSSEANSRVGVNLVGNYGPTVHGDVGGDRSKKDLEKESYQRVAPLEIVAAAGTTGRGRGVFFKLRSTATQVLEGDKAFQVVVRVPVTWRGGLMKVRIRAQAAHRSPLPGLSSEVVTLGDQQFLVAVHLLDDAYSLELANRIVIAERELRKMAGKYDRVIRKRTDGNMLQQMAASLNLGNLDLGSELIPENWLQQAIFANVDPHADRALRRLPVDVRVALLDYQESRNRLLSASRPINVSDDRVAVKSPVAGE